MTYPRELRFEEDVQERLISYIETELLNHYSERSRWMEKLLQWQRDYWAEPRNKQATVPFKGASSIVIPLTAIAVEAIFARAMTQLFALDQLVSAKAKSAAWTDVVTPLENFLNNELLVEMQYRHKVTSAMLEIIKYGTGIGKVGYERLVRYAVRQFPDGSEQEIPVVIRDGAVTDSVAIGRFLMPYSSTDPQTSPWVGEEHSKSPFEILQMEQSGFFREGTFEALKAWINTKSRNSTGTERRFEQSQEKLEKREAVWPNRVDWVEMWLGFKVDGSDREKEIVIHYHRPSRLIMSARYNWHDDLHRPYRVGVYFPVEHRWTGIGVCKQNDQFQAEVTTQHRQRLDNALIANVRMLKVSKLSGYGPDEEIFPGKIWFVDDMSHVEAFQLGEIYNSSFNNEQAALQYSERRTGVSDVLLGQQAAGTPGTATGDLARIQEGAKKFDYAFANMKEFNRSLIIDAAVLVQQFGPRRIEYYTQAENGNLVENFFRMPAELIRHGLLIDLRAAGQNQNKVLDRQNWVSIATLLQQYYTGIMQLVQGTGDARLIQFAVRKALIGSTEAMKQVLDTFDTRNVDRIILSELLSSLQQNGVPQDASRLLPSATPSAGGDNGFGTTGQVPGVDQLTQIIQTLGAGSVQGAGGF